MLHGGGWGWVEITLLHLIMTSVFVICYIVKGLNNCYVANSRGYLADNDVMVMVIKREDRDFSQDRREVWLVLLFV